MPVEQTSFASTGFESLTKSTRKRILQRKKFGYSMGCAVGLDEAVRPLQRSPYRAFTLCSNAWACLACMKVRVTPMCAGTSGKFPPRACNGSKVEQISPDFGEAALHVALSLLSLGR